MMSISNKYYDFFLGDCAFVYSFLVVLKLYEREMKDEKKKISK